MRSAERADVGASCTFFFFSSRRRHTRFDCDWSSDVCSSDLLDGAPGGIDRTRYAHQRSEICRSRGRDIDSTYAKLEAVAEYRYRLHQPEAPVDRKSVV